MLCSAAIRVPMLYLAKCGVLYGDFAKEEVHVVAVLDGVEEMRFCGRWKNVVVIVSLSTDHTSTHFNKPEPSPSCI